MISVHKNFKRSDAYFWDDIARPPAIILLSSEPRAASENVYNYANQPYARALDTIPK